MRNPVTYPLFIPYTVYCTSLLTSHKLDSTSLQTDHNPYFYINVADIETLTCTRTYIACMLAILHYSCT